MDWYALKINIVFAIMILCFVPATAHSQLVQKTYISPFQLGTGGITAIQDDQLSLSSNLSVAGVNAAQGANISVGVLNKQFLPELKTLYIGVYWPGKSANDHFRLSIGRFGFSAFNIKAFEFAYARKLNDFLCISANFGASLLGIEQYGSKIGIGLSLGLSGQMNSQTSFGVLLLLPSKENNEQDIYSHAEFTIALRRKLSYRVQLYSSINKSYIHSLNFSSGVNYKIQKNLSLQCGFSTGTSSISFGIETRKKAYIIQLGWSFAFIAGNKLSIAVSHPL